MHHHIRLLLPIQHDNHTHTLTYAHTHAYITREGELPITSPLTYLRMALLPTPSAFILIDSIRNSRGRQREHLETGSIGAIWHALNQHSRMCCVHSVVPAALQSC